VGARTTRSLRCTKGIYTKPTDISQSTARSTTYPLCFSNTHCCQRSLGTRERERLKEDKKLLQQVPIYFIFEALAGSKKYYSEMEKIFYAVVMSARKLRHYFKAHRIRVLTNQPLNDIFRNHDSSSIVRKWAMELSEHVIDFEKRSVIKSQVLADFIAD
jgi:hypothetical protein